MKTVYLIIKIIVLLVFLLLAVSNTQAVQFFYLPGQEVSLPLILVLFGAFLVGAVFGLLHAWLTVGLDCSGFSAFPSAHLCADFSARQAQHRKAKPQTNSQDQPTSAHTLGAFRSFSAI